MEYQREKNEKLKKIRKIPKSYKNSISNQSMNLQSLERLLIEINQKSNVRRLIELICKTISSNMKSSETPLIA